MLNQDVFSLITIQANTYVKGLEDKCASTGMTTVIYVPKLTDPLRRMKSLVIPVHTAQPQIRENTTMDGLLERTMPCVNGLKLIANGHLLNGF